eukprot:gene6876-30850_t
MGEPVKVTAEQLGVSAGEEYEGQLEYDVGNLTAYDPAPLEARLFTGAGGEEALHEMARAITQSLAAKLFGLPAESVQGGRLATLPDPSTILPREKPIPKPKPLTKWEKFAQEKNIVKRKRSKLVYDEQEQDWKRRHGYKRANDDLDLPIIEASSKDVLGEDPFTNMEAARKQSVKRNKKQQLENVKAAYGAGGKGAIAPTLKLASTLPEKGSNIPLTGGVKRKRKLLKDEIQGASRQAGISTASMGKFYQKLAGEKEGERAPVGKRRQFLSVTDVKADRNKIGGFVDKYLRERIMGLLVSTQFSVLGVQWLTRAFIMQSALHCSPLRSVPFILHTALCLLGCGIALFE